MFAAQSPAAALGVYHLPAGAADARVGTVAAGREALLTAARTVAREAPAAIGRYWVNDAVVGNFIRVGRPGDRYEILEKTSIPDWTASAAKARSLQFMQKLGVQLASAADRAPWRRAGSPTTWNVDPEITVADPQGGDMGFDGDLTARAGKLIDFGLETSSNNRNFAFGSAMLSIRQLQALPADPARLKKLILRGAGNLGEGGADSYLFQDTPSLLTLTVTPAVRAALYRMLAGLPGVRRLGQVRDVAGQRGIAVALTDRFSPCGYHGADGGDTEGWNFRSCVVQQRLVINPNTGLPLAQELRYVGLPKGQRWMTPDGLFSYQLFGANHWTNATPPKF
jgi:hypothetical protein